MVTSRAFVEKAALELPEGVEVIWIEDVRPTIGKVDRAVALALACLAPIRLLEKAAGANAADLGRRHRGPDLQQRQRGRPQGGGPLALQRRLQHRGDRPGLPHLPARPDPRRPAPVPLVRLPAALAGALPRHGPGLPCQAAGGGHGRRPGRGVRRHGPLRHAGVSSYLHATVQPAAVRLAPAGRRRRRQAARLGGPGLRGDLRHQGAGGLRDDRVLAGRGRERPRLPGPGVLPAGLAAGHRRAIRCPASPFASSGPRASSSTDELSGLDSVEAAAGGHRGHGPGEGPQRDDRATSTATT